MSRSIVSRLFSRLRRASSLRSDVVSASGGPFPASMSARFTQSRSARLGQVQVRRDLSDRAVSDPAQANRLGFELWGKRSPLPSLLLLDHGSLPAHSRANWRVRKAVGSSSGIFKRHLPPETRDDRQDARAPSSLSLFQGRPTLPCLATLPCLGLAALDVR